MRVQLQRDDDPSCYDSVLLFPIAPATYVTVEQVMAALTVLLSSPRLPKRQSSLAMAAHAKASKWVSERPPYGWDGRFGESFVFDASRPYDGFRFDVENLVGCNLRS